MNEELKLLWKCKKNIGGGGCQVRPGMGGSRDGGWSIRGLVGSNVGVMWGLGDVNQKLKVLYNVQSNALA